jgi:hypothetical protein
VPLPPTGRRRTPACLLPTNKRDPNAIRVLHKPPASAHRLGQKTRGAATLRQIGCGPYYLLFPLPLARLPITSGAEGRAGTGAHKLAPRPRRRYVAKEDAALLSPYLDANFPQCQTSIASWWGTDDPNGATGQGTTASWTYRSRQGKAPKGPDRWER